MTVQGDVVRGWLQGVRLPLAIAAAVAVRDGDREAWGPVLAFDAVAADAKRTVGRLLRDGALAEEGRLEQQRVDHLREALSLEAQAAQLKAGADAKLETRTNRAESQAESAQRRAAQRKQRLEEQHQRQEERLDEVQAARLRRERELEKKEHEAVAGRKRAARQTRVRAETAALSKEKRALATEAREAEVEQQLQRARARRKAQS